MLNLNIVVEHEDVSELRKEVWQFVFDSKQGLLKLSKHFIARRKSKRSKYQADDSTVYDTYNRRDSAVKEASQVPLTEQVMGEALDQLLSEMKKVKVARWE